MTLGAETWTIIGTVIAVGVTLAMLIMRSTARLDPVGAPSRSGCRPPAQRREDGRVPERVPRRDAAPRRAPIAPRGGAHRRRRLTAPRCPAPAPAPHARLTHRHLQRRVVARDPRGAAPGPASEGLGLTGRAVTRHNERRHLADRHRK